MKPRTLLGCGFLVCLALGLLLGLAELGRRLAGAPDAGPAPGPTPTPDPERFVASVGSLNRFERHDEAGAFRLSYAFIDHHGRRQSVSCRVERAALERERAGFGYDPEWLEREENARLEAIVAREIARRRLAPYFSFETQGERYRWSWRVAGETEPGERERAIAEARRLDAWLEGAFKERIRAVRAELLAERGVRVRGDSRVIDYERLVAQGSEPLGECFRALHEASAGDVPRQRLGLFLAFFQELAYEVPPDADGARRTMGLWGPVEVLVRGRGDCDSKAVAFAALWRRLPPRVLFLLLPRHALVGVEGRPQPGEHFVRIGNRHFLLCEVAGPAKLHPGRTPLSGDYEYLLIEPLADPA